MKSPPEVIDAPAGSPDRLNASALAGKSESVAVAVKASKDSSSIILLPIGARIGAAFTSLTVTVMVSLSVSNPSDTITSNV